MEDDLKTESQVFPKCYECSAWNHYKTTGNFGLLDKLYFYF